MRRDGSSGENALTASAGTKSGYFRVGDFAIERAKAAH
jgi:hypothetical protein